MDISRNLDKELEIKWKTLCPDPPATVTKVPQKGRSERCQDFRSTETRGASTPSERVTSR